MFHIGRVLGGNDHVGDAHRLVVDVLDGHLAFGIGPQPFDRAGLAHAGQLAAQLVGIHDGRGHQFRRFIGRIAEHQSLVAGALLGGFFALGPAGIYTLGDVRTLGGDGIENEHAVGVKHVVVMRVADVTDGLAGDGVVIQLGL